MAAPDFLIPVAELLAAPLEERRSMLELAREEGVAPPTTWRWATRGVRGVRLPTAMTGHRRITTISAYRAWCEHLTAIADGTPVASSTPKQRERQIEAAERELEQMGV